MTQTDEEVTYETSVYCFMDSGRPCTAECVAYQVALPEGDDYKNQNFSRCMLLTNAHKVGKHLTILAQQGNDLLKHSKVKQADALRGVNSPTAPTKVG